MLKHGQFVTVKHGDENGDNTKRYIVVAHIPAPGEGILHVLIPADMWPALTTITTAVRKMHRRNPLAPPWDYPFADHLYWALEEHLKAQ